MSKGYDHFTLPLPDFWSDEHKAALTVLSDAIETAGVKTSVMIEVLAAMSIGIYVAGARPEVTNETIAATWAELVRHRLRWALVHRHFAGNGQRRLQ